MTDPKHTPTFLLVGTALARAGIPFLPFDYGHGQPRNDCTADPARHFLHHQHVYGAHPANDTHHKEPSRA